MTETRKFDPDNLSNFDEAMVKIYQAMRILPTTSNTKTVQMRIFAIVDEVCEAEFERGKDEDNEDADYGAT